MLFVELYRVNVVCWIISRSGISWDRGDGFQTLKYRVSRLSERFRPWTRKKNFKIVYDLCRISPLLLQHPSLSHSLNLSIFFTYVNFRKVMWFDFRTRRGGPSGIRNLEIVYLNLYISLSLFESYQYVYTSHSRIFFTYVNFRNMMWLKFRTRRGGPSGMRNLEIVYLNLWISLFRILLTHINFVHREREREREGMCYIQFDEIWHRNLDQFDKNDRHSF